MGKENANKNEHGTKGITSLEQMVNSLKSKNYIIESQKNYRIADPCYGENQFYFQFVIEFSNHEQWILQHTTSIRDRIKAQQWDSENIKRINQYVKKAYVVVPDNLDDNEKRKATNYNDKIVGKKIYSALDGVYPFDEMYRMIEYKAASLVNSGEAHAKLGLHFEEKIVDSLNNPQNLDKWKNNLSNSVGYLYKLFELVMTELELQSSEVVYIHATADIPRLPSGGKAKTDVLLVIGKEDGEKETYTFSCKRSSADKVSVHEYTAEAFAEVLNPDDKMLRLLLEEFQTVGGVKALNPDSALQLEEKLAMYEERLEKWVLGGVGGQGDPEIQWATHIITVNENTNTYKVSTIEDYILQYKSQGVKGQLGTLFYWTYPSGGKGKRIQLKMKCL